MNIAAYKDESNSESEDELSAENMEPPSDTHDKHGDSVIINILWFFFEMITILKDFYSVSLKPAFNTITNGYFKTRVIAMYKDINDIHAYSTTDEFLYDQYFHTPYKFVVIAKESENGLHTKYMTKSGDGQEINSSTIEQDKKVSNASIMVLRAQLPYSDYKYDINLKIPDNYMVVDNVFNHYFIAWYLSKNYSVSCSEDELLNTKLEFMTSSFKMESVEAPYEIRIKEKDIEIYETEEEYVPDTEDLPDLIPESCNEEDTNLDYTEDIDMISISISESENELDQEIESEIDAPTFPIDRTEGDSHDAAETDDISANRSNSDEEENTASSTGIHFPIPNGTNDVEEDEEEVKKKTKTKKRRGKKKATKDHDMCTCGVCGEEYHISELTDCLLCEHCS